MDQAAIASTPVPGTDAPIDWKLASIDVTNGCLFLFGLLAMIIGAVWVGLVATPSSIAETTPSSSRSTCSR